VIGVKIEVTVNELEIATDAYLTARDQGLDAEACMAAGLDAVNKHRKHTPPEQVEEFYKRLEQLMKDAAVITNAATDVLALHRPGPEGYCGQCVSKAPCPTAEVLLAAVKEITK